jgi:hypothetical protein
MPLPPLHEKFAWARDVMSSSIDESAQFEAYPPYGTCTGNIAAVGTPIVLLQLGLHCGPPGSVCVLINCAQIIYTFADGTPRASDSASGRNSFFLSDAATNSAAAGYESGISSREIPVHLTPQ